MSLIDRLIDEYESSTQSGCDTPDTPRNLKAYHSKPLPCKGCTPDTPDTPQKSIGQNESKGSSDRNTAITKPHEGMSRTEAEGLAVRTTWRWALDSGHGGTLLTNALTFETARHQLEEKFIGHKVTRLEFISAIAEGHGFVPYRPEMGETRQ